MEGVLPRSAFENNAESVHPGDAFPVSITGRNEEGYYELSRFRVAQPRDWSGLEHAYAEKIAVSGTVTEVVKGGLSVDIGVRAFMPASRSGTRDAAELEALVGQPITCRITKLDVADENVVVDRRVVLEEQARGALNERRAALKEGDTVTGTVRTLMPYGAFVAIEPGLDGLLHISDISRARVAKPEDVLSVGEQLTLRVLKIDPGTGKISLGLKQLQPEPWETAAERYVAGQRVAGAVTRLMTLAHSSSSSRGSKASFTFRRWRGTEKSVIPATCSTRATALTPSCSPSSRPPRVTPAASLSASSRRSPIPGSKWSANFLSARKLRAPSRRS